MALTPLQLTTTAISQAAQPASPTANATAQVGKMFSDVLDNLSTVQNNSDTMIQKLAAGENIDLHQVMIASEQTDLTFRVTMAIRDKLVDAYHEIMRMAI